MIWIVFHSDRLFSGYFGGVDFTKGIGSTSVPADVALFRERKGFRVMTLEEYQAALATREKVIDEALAKLEKKAEAREAGRPRKTTKKAR